MNLRLAAHKHAKPLQDPTKDKNPLTVRGVLADLYTSGLRLTIGVVLLALMGIAIAFLVGWIDPKTQILLAGFRGPSDQKVIDSTALAGEASDMFSDSLNQVLEMGRSDPGRRGSSLKSPQARLFGPAPQVPISRTYGIEFKGISVDKIIAIWNQIRYNQETVTGDIVPVDGEKRYILYLTWRKGDSIGHWTGKEFSIVDAEMETAMKDAALYFVRETNPEIAGRYALSSGRYDDAMAIFSEWMRLNPLRPEPYWYIAKTFDWQSEFVRALPFADRAQALLSQAPRGRRGDLQTGIYLIQSLQYFYTDPDVTRFQRFVDTNLSHDPDAMTNLGLRYLQRGELGNAEKTLNAALKLDKRDYVADGLLGDAYEAGHNYPLAVKAFESEVGLAPSFIPAATNYVRSLNEAGDFGTASAYCSSWVYPVGSAGVLTKASEADIFFWCAKAEEEWHPSRPDTDQPDRQRWYEAKALAVKTTAGPEMNKTWFSSDHIIDSLLTLHQRVCKDAQSSSPQFNADMHDGIQALNDSLQKSVNDPMIEPKVKDAVNAAISDCQKVAAKLQPAMQKVSGAPASARHPVNVSLQAGR